MKLDVAILGGGLAGATVARQLRRTLPDLAIGLFERSDDGGFKVGESTVEIASNYLTRRLGLASYLYENHLPKNGLRFFFDDPTRSTPLEQMAEIGTDALPYHAAFQIDRARIDRDLRHMNAKDGVTVKIGARVVDLQPGTAGAPHRFTAISDGEGEADGSRTEVEARWLIDASGRARLLGRALGEHRTDVGHATAGAWGRVRGLVDPDDYGAAPWRGRVRNTSRLLSTTHLMYPGYWIWFIPIARGVVSIGVVCDKSIFRDSWRTPDGLLGFLRSHHAAAELLPNVEILDAMGYGQIAYGGGSFFNARDRWARVGEANVFSDPLYSPGSDFIALENDFTTALVADDVGGATPDQLERRAQRFDAFVQFRFEATLRLYRDLYQCLGSRELFGLKWDFDIHSYYNLWYHAFAMDSHLDDGWLDDQLALRGPVLSQLANFSRLFATASGRLRERGTYHRANLGGFTHALRAVDFVQEIGRPRSRKQILRSVSAISNATRAGVVSLLDDRPRAEVEPWPLGAYMIERDLAAGPS